MDKLSDSAGHDALLTDEKFGMCEEFACWDNFIVKCRRKVGCRWTDGQELDEQKPSAGQRRRLGSRLSSDPLNDEPADDESLRSASDFTDDEPLVWEARDSDEDDDMVSELDSEELEQLGGDSDDDLMFREASSESSDAAIDSRSSESSDGEERTTEDDLEDASDITSSDGDTEATSDWDEHPKSRLSRYYPRIEQTERAKETCCNGCGKVGLRRWLSCRTCHEIKCALCWHCFQRRKWCGNTGHQLLEWKEDDTVGVRTWKKQCKPQQMIQIVDSSSSPPKVELELTRREPQLLHYSPPVIQPEVPLLAWAASSSALLLSSFGSQRWQKSIRLRPALVNGHNISIDLQFSQDGHYLHIGILEAAKIRPPTGPRSLSTRYALLTKLMTLKIKTTPSGHATLTSMTTLHQRVGCIDRPFLTTLPFTWTWTDSHAYFTLSDERLTLLRFPLPQTNPQNPPSATPLVTSPSEPLFLPRSAKHRTAYFYPASPTFSQAILILGPRYPTQEPMIVYLKDEDLGEWKEHAVEDECGSYPQRRRDGLFEGLDADLDCHIRPFDDVHRDLAAKR